MGCLTAERTVPWDGSTLAKYNLSYPQDFTLR